MSSDAFQRPNSWHYVVVPIALAILSFVTAVGGMWLPTTRFGGHGEFAIFLFVLAPIVPFDVVTIPVSLALLIFRRRHAWYYLSSAMCILVAFILGARIGNQWRMAAFR